MAGHSDPASDYSIHKQGNAVELDFTRCRQERERVEWRAGKWRSVASA